MEDTVDMSSDTTSMTDVDIAVASDDFVQVPVTSEHVGASLPTPEEVRATVHMGRSKQGTNKAMWGLVLGLIVILSLIIGVSVGVGNNNKSSASNDGEFDPFFFGRLSTVQQVTDYFSETGVSNLAAMTAPGTPQNRAVTWLAEEDEANIAVPLVKVSARAGYSYMTRYILAVFYYSTDGPNWINDNDFLSIDDICGWNKVNYDGARYFRQGIYCDSTNGLIFGLDIDSNQLAGTIPSEIGMLNTLKILSLNTNGIEGELPTTLCRLSNLEEFEISFNSIEGRIPQCINEMQALRIMFLSNNALTGPLPATIGFLSNLQGIVIDDNELSGEVANLFNNLPKLQWLHLENNDFYGTITDSFLKTQTSLLQVDISSNKFKGTLPSHLFSKPELELLDVHDNKLGGFLPRPILENEKLLFLSIHDNQFSGDIPSTIANLRALLHIDLSSNLLSGDFPTELGLMRNLTYFFASANDDFTTGIIPPFLEALPDLQELGLKSTNRQGGIPTFLGLLTTMTLLDLDDNLLFGQIPTELARMTDLEFLLLNRNALSGTVPTEFSSLTSLRMAFLEKNSLVGDLASLCRLPIFQTPVGDIPLGREVLAADCDATLGAPEITCACCSLCCSDLTSDCNDNYEIPNLDPRWEARFNRLSFTFGAETSFFASDVFPSADDP